MKNYTISIVLFSLLFLYACGGSKHYITESTPPPITPKDTTTITPLQAKYAKLLDIAPEEVKDETLYKFVDEWLGTPYLLGGETKTGIDCSAFAQHLYNNVYDHLLERTAHKQYKAKSTQKFLGQEFLKEGDLLFFKDSNSDNMQITHVGIYLTNNKFISATSYRGPSSVNGVKISDLTLPYWQKKFVAAGRKMLKKYRETETK